VGDAGTSSFTGRSQADNKEGASQYPGYGVTYNDDYDVQGTEATAKSTEQQTEAQPQQPGPERSATPEEDEDDKEHDDFLKGIMTAEEKAKHEEHEDAEHEETEHEEAEHEEHEHQEHEHEEAGHEEADHEEVEHEVSPARGILKRLAKAGLANKQQPEPEVSPASGIIKRLAKAGLSNKQQPEPEEASDVSEQNKITDEVHVDSGSGISVVREKVKASGFEDDDPEAYDEKWIQSAYDREESIDEMATVAKSKSPLVRTEAKVKTLESVGLKSGEAVVAQPTINGTNASQDSGFEDDDPMAKDVEKLMSALEKEEQYFDMLEFKEDDELAGNITDISTHFASKWSARRRRRRRNRRRRDRRRRDRRRRDRRRRDNTRSNTKFR
jgi:hypothetical protein